MRRRSKLASVHLDGVEDGIESCLHMHGRESGHVELNQLGSIVSQVTHLMRSTTGESGPRPYRGLFN